MIKVFLFLICLLASPLQGALDEIVHSLMQENQIPGMAIAVYEEGKGFTKAYGYFDVEKKIPMTTHSLLALGSITKVFTSTAIALEIEKGRMSLKDPITKYLPYLPKITGKINQVTLEDLLTHTSSLPRDLEKGLTDRSKLNDFLIKWHPDTPIGTKYVYSNLGFGVLGYALENVEHLSYEQVIQKLILQPLHMNSTVIEISKNQAQGYNPLRKRVIPKKPGILPGGGALKSSAEDMLKFLEANLGVYGPDEIKEAMQLTQQGHFKVNSQLTLGLGWQLFEKGGMLIVDKNGGVPGFSSYIGMIPEKKMGIVVLMNKAKTNSTQIGRRLLQQL